MTAPVAAPAAPATPVDPGRVSVSRAERVLDPLCDRSDLPRRQCYHCRGLEDVVVPELGLPVIPREVHLPRLAMAFEQHVAFTPVGCDGCGRVIRRGERFQTSSDGYHWCRVCL